MSINKHEKTQRFLRGRCAPEEGMYIYKEQRLIAFRALAHMLNATQLGGGGLIRSLNFMVWGAGG